MTQLQRDKPGYESRQSDSAAGSGNCHLQALFGSPPGFEQREVEMVEKNKKKTIS